MDILAHFTGHFNPTHYLTLREIEAKITDKTRAIVIVTPNNRKRLITARDKRQPRDLVRDPSVQSVEEPGLYSGADWVSNIYEVASDHPASQKSSHSLAELAVVVGHDSISEDGVPLTHITFVDRNKYGLFLPNQNDLCLGSGHRCIERGVATSFPSLRRNFSLKFLSLRRSTTFSPSRSSTARRARHWS